MTVYKMIECVGTSGTSVSDAIRAALSQVGAQVEAEEGEESVYGPLRWFEVKEIRGAVAGTEPSEFQVKLVVASEMRITDESVGVRKQGQTRQTRSVAAQVAAKGGQKKRDDLARGFDKQRSRR
jgi:flavin-binding protein dodecin